MIFVRKLEFENLFVLIVVVLEENTYGTFYMTHVSWSVQMHTEINIKDVPTEFN